MLLAISKSSSYKDQLLSALGKFPPLSPVLKKVLASLDDENVSFGELAAIIETDTVLTGQVLRVVNSPLYGRRSTIASVRHGVVVLGAIKTRNLVLSLSLSKSWARSVLPRRWTINQFNSHCLAVAVLSDLLAVEQVAPYAERAFIAGLLHDIGKLLISVTLPNKFDEVYVIWEQDEQNALDYESELLGISHAELGGELLRKWALPVPICEAVAHHHRPAAAAEGHFHLAHLIEAADAHVNKEGLEVGPSSRRPQQVIQDPLPDYGIQESIIKTTELFHTEYKAVCSGF